MSQAFAAVDAVWRVLAIGVVLGAGLPALFSLGVRQLAVAAGETRHAIWHRVFAWSAFAVVGIAVVLGITGIVAHGLGYELFGW